MSPLSVDLIEDCFDVSLALMRGPLAKLLREPSSWEARRCTAMILGDLGSMWKAII